MLNLHDWGSVRGDAAFDAILNDFPVSAVFAGHWHSVIGQYETKGPFADGRRVPILLSGSAHYGSFLVSRFVGSKLYVWIMVVDHFDGSRLRVKVGGALQPATDLSSVFSICAGCTRRYEYVYDLR